MKIGALLLLAGVCVAQTVHYVKPGENPQAILDSASPGDRLVFLPGMHAHPLRKHQSLLYVDKAIDIELQAGATLKLADNQMKLQKDPELTTDHGVFKKIDDIEIGGDYDLGLGETLYTIQIDGGGSPDTFKWGSGGTFDIQHTKVPITGDWQELSHGVKIRFPNKTGHSNGSVWFISYDGPVSYGIRVGHGLQPEYIENVRIFGKGTIDLNLRNNAKPSGMVKDINACILVHGRVRNVSIEEVTMMNTNRSVMLYGEHTGKFLQGGATTPGESFDAENITIFNTRTINPNGSGYLLGHPSHRGRLSKVRCNYNYMETATTSIEPNFNLDQYEVIGNVIKSGGRAIHCWRKSTNGLIANNVRIDDTKNLEVVMVNAPASWQNPENIVLRDNRNHHSDPIGYWANISGGQDNRATGRWATVGGGSKNAAEGLGATVAGGVGNVASGEYSAARGWNARATRPGEEALASGMFASAGDAQSSQMVLRGVTRDASPVVLEPGIALPPNASVAFRALVVARSSSGSVHDAFETSGVVSGPALKGGHVTPLAGSRLGLRVFADTGMLRLEARGVAESEVRWVARVELVEVAF